MTLPDALAGSSRLQRENAKSSMEQLSDSLIQLEVALACTKDGRFDQQMLLDIMTKQLGILNENAGNLQRFISFVERREEHLAAFKKEQGLSTIS